MTRLTDVSLRSWTCTFSSNNGNLILDSNIVDARDSFTNVLCAQPMQAKIKKLFLNGNLCNSNIGRLDGAAVILKTTISNLFFIDNHKTARRILLK